MWLRHGRAEVDLQRRLSLHPNVVRFMGACCHIPNTGRTLSDDTLDNWQARADPQTVHHADFFFLPLRCRVVLMQAQHADPGRCMRLVLASKQADIG